MNYMKTALLLVFLTLLLVWVGGIIGGAQGAFIAFIFSLGLNGVSYWYSDKIVLKLYNAREVSREQYARLYDIVEELAANAGIPAPKVYMTETGMPNAFATGRDPQNAAVCVTKGIVDLLSDDEIRGVISHEMAHIRNRDTLIMTVTAALASAVMMIAYMARWAAILGGFSRDRRDSGNLIALIAISIIAPLAALLIQLAISRSREYAADAAGAGISHAPGALADALGKLQEAATRRPLEVAPQTAHLFIVSPLGRNFVANLFSTHPPMEERVKRLRSMA